MHRLLILCFVVYACSDSSRPKDVLPQEKMQAVLYDVIRADEMVDFLKLSDSTWQPFSRRAALYDTIFQLQGIKKEAFKKSMDYYQSRPDLLKGMLENMEQKVRDTSKTVPQRRRLD